MGPHQLSLFIQAISFSARHVLQYYLTKEAKLPSLLLSLMLLLKVDKGGDGEHIRL
jgi:hypothetical protein